MSRIKSKKTFPELAYLKDHPTLDYQPKLFGRPDFVDWKKKKAIFIDGCFWHGCPEHGKIPETNSDFWRNKIMRNKIRDQEINLAYRSSGWSVERFWEHRLKKR
jgi:DNA mismatch endonuclease (patch repair protein)